MSGEMTVPIDADRVQRIVCSRCGHHMDLEGFEPFSEVECPKCSEKQRVPLRLGSFLLLEEFGRGGMGTVYRAYDETLGRLVAIKVMKKKFAEDAHFAENFLREARAAAALNHPNVVQIYSCGQQRDQLYIVMELVGGGRLDKMIKGGRAIGEVRALEIGLQVSEGLQAANEIGLIHGDIKPENILFGNNDQAKVVDFGLARFLDKSAHPGEIWGTPYYIAPEKVRRQPEDHRADIYSLGATLYHALSGNPPFEGDTAKDVVLARLKDPAISLRVVVPSLQPETADVIARMLEAEPNMRYPTYKSLQADLREALRVAQMNEDEGSVSIRKKSRTPIVIGGLVLLAVALGLFALLRRELREPELPPPPTLPEEVAVPPPEEVRPEIVYETQPFTGERETAIVEAAAAFAEGRSRDMEQKLESLFEQLPRRGVERPWVGVLQAVPAWVEGRERDMLRHLRRIQDATLRELEEDEPHPGAMPQTLARLIVGQVSPERAREEAAHWPDWFADLTRFFIAVHHLKQGELAEARREWESYAGIEPPDPAWPYAFQPLARKWTGHMTEWEQIRKQAAEDEPRAALTALKEYREEAEVFLADQVEAEIARAEERVREQEEREERARREEEEQRIQADLERVEEWSATLQPHLARKEYRQAGLEARRFAAELETEEGRAALNDLQESYERMDAVKNFLIREIERNPFRRHIAPEIGDAAGATLHGIRVSLGAHGTALRPWDRISERTMVTLADYYLSNARLEDDERADLTLSLAVFCYRYGGFRLARQYAEQAVQYDPGLAPQVDRLMPDLEDR